MTPGIDIRIQSIINGLQDVIFPAVDPAESLAMEQKGMIIAQLEMILKQLPLADRYHRLCRDDMQACAERMATDPAGGEATMAACASLQERLAHPADTPRDDYNRIGKAADALIAAVGEDGEDAYRKRVDEVMFGLAQRQIWRDRVWCADVGFDPYPEELCPIEDMVTGKVTAPSSGN
jgi:hypothetical protein